MGEFNATLLENNANSQNTYMCGDYNVDCGPVKSK